MLIRLRQSEYLKIDSTFHYPKGYSQFLIIMYYDQILDKYIPGIFVIMNSKNEAAYDAVFETVNKILKIGYDKKINFKGITTDNEQGLINSIHKYYPKAFRIAFWFHMKQSLVKRARSMGLKDNENELDTLTLINSLGLLPLIYNGNYNTIKIYTDQFKEKYKNHMPII